MSGYISGEAEADGPPSTTTLPAAWARSAMVVDLRRLHVHAADHHDVRPFEFGRRVALRMFSSMKRTGHCCGI